MVITGRRRYNRLRRRRRRRQKGGLLGTILGIGVPLLASLIHSSTRKGGRRRLR